MKGKFTKYIFFVDMGIFPGTLLVSTGFSRNELIKELSIIKATDWADAISDDFLEGEGLAWYNQHSVTKRGDKTFYYMIGFRKPFKKNDEHYVALAHEVLHICQLFLPRVLDRNKEREAEAYLNSYLMSKILNELK